MTALEHVVRRLIALSPHTRSAAIDILGSDDVTRADVSSAEFLTLLWTRIVANMKQAGVSAEDRYREMHTVIDSIFDDPRTETIACRDELARIIADGFGYDLTVTETAKDWYFFYRPRRVH